MSLNVLSVIDSDRIMVLGGGRIEEFGAPDELLKDSKGAFSGMWKKHVDSHH